MLHHPLKEEIRENARRSAEELPWSKTTAQMLQLHGLQLIGEQAPSVSIKSRIRVA